MCVMCMGIYILVDHHEGPDWSANHTFIEGQILKYTVSVFVAAINVILL